MTNNRIILAITGASGSIYGIRLLEELSSLNIETHLIVTESAEITLSLETDVKLDYLKNLASYTYDNKNIAASIASGSFKNRGMIIAPCSIKTMSQVATGNIGCLTTRAADVALKERRKLVLMVRETPFHLGHLQNMTNLTAMGVIIAPPLPAFYTHPKTLDDIINHSVGRILDMFDIENHLVKRWNGA